MDRSTHLNAGVIGLGVGEKHVRAYQDHPQVNLVAICDFKEERLKQIKKGDGRIATYVDDQKILRDESLNIISVASYDHFHAKQIVQALNNGKHVMAEKPMCTSLAELIQIKQTLQENPELRVSANHVLRTNSRFKRFKTEIQENEFGDIFYLEGDYFWGRKHKLFGWRAEMDYYSIILGAAIHMIDLVMWLLDERPVEIQVMGNNIPSKDSNLRGNSFAVMLLRFENGAIAKLTGNAGCVHPHFHGLKIFGSQKTLIQDYEGARYYLSSDPDRATVAVSEPYPEKQSRPAVIHSFVDSILDRFSPPLVSQKDVFDVMSIGLAAEKAMTSGHSVEIQYVRP